MELVHQLVQEFLVILARIITMPGNKIQVAAEVAGAIQPAPPATQVRALIGTIPTLIVHGIIQVQEVLGVTLLLVIPVPAAVADSRAVVDLVVVGVVIAVVVDTEDDKIIRSSFYSI
jgi:hypothetical protein